MSSIRGICPLCFANAGLVVEFQELTSGTAVDVAVLELALDPAAFLTELGAFFGVPTASQAEPLLAYTGGVAERC